MPGQAQAVEGAPVVVHGGQSPHVVNGGQIIQKLEVLGGSQLGVSTVGRPPHQRIKYVVVGWVRIVQAFSDRSGDQSAAVRQLRKMGASGSGWKRCRRQRTPDGGGGRRLSTATSAKHKSEQYC